MRRYILSLVLAGWITCPVFAGSGKYAASFLELGIGARALGMGSAHVALSSDATGFYWNPDQKATDSVREYLSFEFSPDVADDMLEVVRIFEQNHRRKRIKDSALHAFELVTKAETRLTQKVKNSWRWRIFSLRAIIDKELFERKGKREGQTLKQAFDKLTRIYRAEDAHSMPIKPPQLD